MVNWPPLTFPPINLWSVFKRIEPWVKETEDVEYISPCIGVCKLDKDKDDTNTSVCIGCGRTIEEIKKAGSIDTQA